MAARRTVTPKMPAPSAQPQPPGATAPADPPKAVNEDDQRRLLETIPANGFLLGRVILADERASLGFSPGSPAFQSSALVEVVSYASGDDEMRRAIPVGSHAFASLEEIAPLLGTHLFLIPFARVQGHLPAKDAAPAQGVGFTSS